MPAIYHEGSWLGNATDPEVLVKDTVGWTGKNLLKNEATTQTVNGITFTVNADKSVTVNGTNTIGRAGVFELNTYLELKAGSYILSGAPENVYSSSGVRIQVWDINGGQDLVLDYGSGAAFTLSSDLAVMVRLWFNGTASVSNKTFCPMIRKADITDPTYEPYHESVEVMYEEEIHGVNLLDYTATSKTQNGITYTVNADKSITVNGTNSGTSEVTLNLASYALIPNEWKNTEIILTSNVGYMGFGLIFVERDANGAFLNQHNANPTPQKFILLDNAKKYSLYIYVAKNITVNNLVMKPMLRKATIEDSTYRPYNHQAIQNQLNAQGVLGAKNLLRSKNTAKTITIAGVTFTVDDDGSITANGIATADVSYEFVRGTNDVLEKGKSYIASTGQTANGGLQVYYKVNNSNSWVQLANVVTEEKEFFLPSNANFILIRIFFSNGNTVSNEVYYPMLRLASDPDDTYQPYAMTNRELTEKKINIADLKTVVSASSDFADFKTRIASL